MVGFIFGSIILAVGLSWAYRFAFKTIKSVTYQPIPLLWGLYVRNKVVSITYRELSGDEMTGRFFGSAVIAVATVIATAVSYFS